MFIIFVGARGNVSRCAYQWSPVLYCVSHTMKPGNNFGMEGAKTLVPALERLSHLKELWLRGE